MEHRTTNVEYGWLLRRWIGASLSSFGELSGGGWRSVFSRAAFLLGFAGLQLVHWIGFLLDEVLFPRYRTIEVREPLFVLGMPRTGTTFLQQILAADDERFTTLRLWELVLAPSITERKLAHAAIAADRSLGRPVARLWRRIEGMAFHWMDHVHPVALDNPEEDYLFLLPVFACFLLVVAFPDHPRVWDVARFDELEERDRRAILGFYRSCVQRHLYCSGGGRRLLSKNPSFAPMVSSLAECFPDARFLCSVRDPVEAVPSLLNSMQSGAEFFGWDMRDPKSTERFVGMLEYSARHPIETFATLDRDRYAFVPLPSLKEDAGGTVLDAYGRFGWQAGDGFRQALADSTESGRRYRSRHRYALADFGLSPDDVRARFPEVLDILAEAAGTHPNPRSAGVRS